MTQSGQLTLPTTGVALAGMVIADVPANSPLIVLAAGGTNSTDETITLEP